MDLIVPNELLRGARAALGMSQKRLAELSTVTLRTVQSVETDARVSAHTLQGLAAALTTQGVVFLPSTGQEGPGLRLPPASAPERLLKAARSTLGLTIAGLARSAETSERTVQRLEGGRPVFPNTKTRLRTTLEQQGITFLSGEPGSEPGFRIALDILSRQDLRF